MKHNLIFALAVMGVWAIIGVGLVMVDDHFSGPQREAKRIVEAICEGNETEFSELCKGVTNARAVLVPFVGHYKPLFEAISNSRHEMAEAILQKLDEAGELESNEEEWYFALINLRVCGDDNPLIHAIRKSDIKMMSLLIKRGAAVNFGRSSCKPPLYHAFQSGEIQKVRLLMEAGARISLCDSRDMDAFVREAIDFENYEMAEFFLADASAVEVICAYLSPTKIKHRAFLEKFVQNRKIGLELLVTTLKADNVELCSYFWNNLPKGDKKTLLEAQYRGNTLLMWTAKHWNERTPEWLALLFQENPNLDMQDTEGRTVLLHALNASNSQLAVLLLQQGANPDLPDNRGATPRMEFRRQVRESEKKQGLLVLAPQIMDLMK